MPRINKKRHVSWHETWKCKYRLDASVCNYKQLWNNDKCRCESKGLIDKGKCDDGFIWNPSLFKCEFNKSCGVGEYLDHANYKCRARLLDKLVEECRGDINGNEMI